MADRSVQSSEELARRLVEQHLGRTVAVHDVGGTSQYDLRVGPANAPEIAIEVTAAVDELWVKTWEAGLKMSGRIVGVEGDWTIEVRPGASIRDLRKKLPIVVAAIQDTGLDAVHEEDLYRRPDLRDLLVRLGVTDVYRNDSGRNHVQFVLGGDGGAVDSTGESVPGWIGELAAEPGRADNLHKLTGTGAPQRELFVIAELVGAPWSVMSYLTDISRHSAKVPPAPPTLPAPLTGVWLMSSYSFGDPGDARGVRWDGTRWSTFHSTGPSIDDVAND